MTKDRNQENPIDGNIYPTIELTKGKELAPHIRLPDNYRELVPIFYEKGGRKDRNTYCGRIKEGWNTLFGFHIYWADELQWRSLCY